MIKTTVPGFWCFEQFCHIFDREIHHSKYSLIGIQLTPPDEINSEVHIRIFYRVPKMKIFADNSKKPPIDHFTSILISEMISSANFT